ncbi:MAG: hypothetical protein ABIQ73_04360 [Acidimicrobiales bacterium]
MPSNEATRYHWSGLVWLNLNAWVSSMIVFATLAVSIATRPSRDYPVGVMVSDRRVVTAQMRTRGRAPIATIAVVEGSRLNPRVVEILCNGAQIDVTYPPSPPPTRWWLPKAFVVVMLFIVGLTMTVVAGITLMQQRDIPALAMTSIGIALTAVAEGLRRRLLRRNRRGDLTDCNASG